MHPHEAERHLLAAQRALDLARRRLRELHENPEAHRLHYANDEVELRNRIRNAEARLAQAREDRARADPRDARPQEPASFHDRSRY